MRPLDRLPEIGERIVVRLVQAPPGPFFPARVATLQEVRSLRPDLFGGPDGSFLGWDPDRYRPDDTVRGYVCDDGYAGFCIMHFPGWKAEFNHNIGFP